MKRRKRNNNNRDVRKFIQDCIRKGVDFIYCRCGVKLEFKIYKKPIAVHCTSKTSINNYPLTIRIYHDDNNTIYLESDADRVLLGKKPFIFSNRDEARDIVRKIDWYFTVLFSDYPRAEFCFCDFIVGDLLEEIGWKKANSVACFKYEKEKR